jgi:hypothetical protein
MLNYSAKYEALERIKNKEIEELKVNFSSFSRESYESTISTVRVQF